MNDLTVIEQNPVITVQRVDLVQNCQSLLAVCDEPSQRKAGELIALCAKMRKEIGSVIDPVVAAANAAHKKATQMRSGFLAPVEVEEKRLRGLSSAYLTEQTRISEEKAQAKRRAAIEAAQAEQCRVEEAARIERERNEAELRRLQEDARRKAEKNAESVSAANALKRAEQMRIQKERMEQQTAYAKAEADRLMAEAVQTTVAPVKVETDGMFMRTNWKWQIENADLIPNEFMVPDEKKIEKYVKAMKESGKIPGVRIYSVQTPIIR